jgi:hypothetical protein
MQVLSTLILCSAGLAFAYEVPANLQEIYKSHKVNLACPSIIYNGPNIYRPLNVITYSLKDLAMEAKAPTWVIAAT